MKRKGLRAAVYTALLLTLFLVGYGLWGRPDASRNESVRDPIRSESIGAGGAPAEPESSSKRADVKPADTPAEKNAPRIGGRVEARDGTGVGGVHVVAIAEDGKVRETAVTDADGRFEFELSGSARLAIARFEGLDTRPSCEVQFEQGAAGAVLAFDGIAGTVTAADGSLLTHGVVLARFAGEDAIVANAPLTPQGAFGFHRLQPGHYVLTYKTHVYGSEYEMTDGGIDLEEWRTGVDLRLADGATIEGTVVDGAGAPKPQVWIRTTRDTVLTGDYTDEQGQFRIEGLVPDRTYLLTVWSPGFVPEKREVRAGERDVRFELDPGLRSTGVLRGSDGLAVAGKQLAFRFGSGSPTLLFATTAADGAFVIGGLPDERIEVLVAEGGNVPCGTFRAGELNVELQLPPP